MEFLLLSFLLGCDNYRMREAAHTALENKTSVELCLIVPLNLESKHRLRQLKEIAHSKDIANYIKRKKGGWPPIEYSSLTYHYLKHPSNDASEDDPSKNLWPRYRKATELYVRDRLNCGETFEDMEKYLKQLEITHEMWTSRWKLTYEK